jgi:hypothetical protein
MWNTTPRDHFDRASELSTERFEQDRLAQQP